MQWKLNFLFTVTLNIKVENSIYLKIYCRMVYIFKKCMVVASQFNELFKKRSRIYFYIL